MAAPATKPKSAPPAGGSGMDEKFLAHSLEQYARGRAGFARDVKVSVALLGLLLVFFFQYIPLAAEEVDLAGAYNGEKDALMAVVGGLEELSRIVTDGSQALDRKVSSEVTTAQDRIVQLDGYLRGLSANPELAAPAFLDECQFGSASAADEIGAAAGTGPVSDTTIGSVVQHCIIAPMASALKRERNELLVVPFRAAKEDLLADLATERAVAARYRGVLNRIGVAAAPDDLETKIQDAERAIDAKQVIAPAPEDWWTTYAGDPATFASFRDNVLFFFPNRAAIRPTPAARATTNATTTPAVRPSGGEIAREDLSFSIGQLQASLTTIDTQEQSLREKMDGSVQDLQTLLPDYAQPLLAIARPKYIVLGYPVLLAGVAMYLMMSFAVLQRRITRLRDACNEPGRLSLKVLEVTIFSYTWIVFAALCLIPLLPIVLSLYALSDRPELDRAAPYWLYAITLVVFVVFMALSGLAIYTPWLDGFERGVPWWRSRPTLPSAPASPPPAPSASAVQAAGSGVATLSLTPRPYRTRTVFARSRLANRDRRR